jgi:WD40 repeat protein
VVLRVTLESTADLVGGAAASLAFGGEGHTLVGAGGGAIYVWRDGKLEHTLAPPTDAARGAIHVTDGRASIGPHVLDLARVEFEPRPALQASLGASFQMMSADLSADGRDLVVSARYQPPRGLRRGGAGAYSGPTHRVLVLSAADRSMRGVLYEGSGWSDYTALAAGDAFLVAGGEKLLVWTRAELRPLADAAAHSKAIRDVAFDSQERRLATVAADGTAHVWQTDAWRPSASWQAHADACVAVRFHPRLELLATAGLDGVCRLWSAEGGRLAEVALSGQGEAVAFDPAGEQLAVSVAGAQPLVRLYRVHAH